MVTTIVRTRQPGDKKPQRKWQNLLHKKCPNCNERLEDRRLFFACPSPHKDDPNKSCFFIKKTKVMEYLLDPNHPAHTCLTKHEKENLDKTLKSFGIVIE